MTDTTDLALRMIEQDKPRNKYFKQCDDAYHCNWEMPPELQLLPWSHKHVSQKLHNAIAASVKVLSTKHAKIKKYPYLPDEANKQQANEDERNLEWHLHNASLLRSEKLESDFVESALLYKCVGAMVIDIDWQIKQAKALKMDTTAMERAREKSRFAVNPYKPAHLHVRRSVYGVDTVLLAYKRSAAEVVMEWGKDNIPKEIKEIAKEKDDAIYYFDLMDYKIRGVWVQKELDSEPYWIMNEVEHGLDFLPWVAELGGSSLEDNVAHKYQSMPYAAITSGALETQNVIGTLLLTDAIAKAIPAEFAIEGFGTEETTIDAMDPHGIVKVGAGNTIKALQKSGMDPRLAELYDRASQDVSSATIPDLLMSGQLPSGMAFSTYNLATQTGIGQLKPYKELAEKGTAEVCRLFLMWSRHTNVALEAYGTQERGDIGKSYKIDPETIDPTGIYIKAELIPMKPTDDLAKWNAGTIANQVGLPMEYILEDAGVEDPQEALKLWEGEKIDAHLLEMWKQKQMIDMQMEAQARQMQQQQEAQQMAQEMQMGGGAVPGGQGFNPEMGGTPPIRANPPENQLREQVLGQGGEPLA